MTKFISRTKNPSVSVISVNFNGEKWLPGFFKSIRNQKGVNVEMIFVDNNSNDDSLKITQKLFPKAKIIQNKSNLGFGKANNQGVEIASGEILFFLNTDIEIPDPYVLNKMAKYLLDKKVFILGPRIVDFDGFEVTRGKKMGLDIFSSPGLSKKLFYIDGCSIMIKKKDFIDLGKFDEKYFMYSEDIDLSWRARLFDKKLAVYDEVYIKHFGGGSSSSTHLLSKTKHTVPQFRRYEVEKNNLRNILKNYQFLTLIFILPLFCLLNLAEALLYLMTRQPRVARKITSSLWWNFINIDDTLRERIIIQKRRKVSDWEIVKQMTFLPNKLVTFFYIGIPKII